INGGSRFIKINHIPVSKQNESIDCGLFALGYALALAMDIDPEMSSIFKIQNKSLTLFSYTLIDNYKKSNYCLFSHILRDSSG
ncbi:hypothetical protein BpHYR1_000828, partial [Brachionus plicatilis]